jgi:hypothetical protein
MQYIISRVKGVVVCLLCQSTSLLHYLSTSLPLYFSGFFSSLIAFNPYPFSTSSELLEGDLKTGSNPDPVFGKAMTSLILLVSHRMAINRSNPRAIPPCGGAPNLRAWRRCENLPISSSSSYIVSCINRENREITLRTSFMMYSCNAASWTRTLPPPIS